MGNNKVLHMVSFALLVIGGLNWGLIGLLNFNLVDTIFGVGGLIGKLVYILVGVSAVYIAATHKKSCRECGGMGGSTMPKGKQGM